MERGRVFKQSVCVSSTVCETNACYWWIEELEINLLHDCSEDMPKITSAILRDGNV